MLKIQNKIFKLFPIPKKKMSSFRAKTPGLPTGLVTRFRFFDSGVLFFDAKLTPDGWVDTVYPTPRTRRKKKAGKKRRKTPRTRRKKRGKLAAMWKKHLSCQ